jgi:hypothetical protein
LEHEKSVDPRGPLSIPARRFRFPGNEKLTAGVNVRSVDNRHSVSIPQESKLNSTARRMISRGGSHRAADGLRGGRAVGGAGDSAPVPTRQASGGQGNARFVVERGDLPTAQWLHAEFGLAKKGLVDRSRLDRFLRRCAPRPRDKNLRMARWLAGW